MRHTKEAQMTPDRLQKSSDVDKFKVEEIQLLLPLCCQGLITKVLSDVITWFMLA